MYKNSTKHRKHTAHTSDYDISDDLLKIKAALKDATRDVRGRAQEVFTNSYDDLKDKSYEMREKVSDRIVEKPLQSVGIGFAIGALVGFLLRR